MENYTRYYQTIKGLSKGDILKYASRRCEHRQPLLSHPSCLAKAVGYKEKVGYLDLETSNFSATFGVMVTWCLKEEDGEILYGYLKPEDFKDKNAHYDKRITKDCVDSLSLFDRIIVYWGKDRRFDIPFLRSRALMMDIEFPFYHQQVINDLYDVVRNKMKLGRNSLQAACTALKIGSKETPLSPETWVRATIGREKKAIQTILQHNREDVISTEKLHKRIRYFGTDAKSSI